MINGVNHITIAVSQLNRSFDFYVNVLKLKPHARWSAGAYLSSGELWICLSCDTTSPAGDYSHIAFDVSPGEFDKVARQLRSAGITEWKDNSSEGNSVYFLDPDGHKLEIHSGTLQDRLASMAHSPYDGLQLFKP